jgi:hypothetical protein
MSGKKRGYDTTLAQAFQRIFQSLTLHIAVLLVDRPASDQAERA